MKNRWKGCVYAYLFVDQVRIGKRFFQYATYILPLVSRKVPETASDPPPGCNFVVFIRHPRASAE